MPQLVDVLYELFEMGKVFHEDAIYCLQALETADTQVARRQLFRAVFAEIDGGIYGLKQLALAAFESQSLEISQAEDALLREEAYDLDDKGMPRARAANLPFATNCLFAIRTASRALGGSFEPPTGDTGWQKLRESARVRNRVTHPKSAKSLEISRDEVQALHAGREWFGKCRNAVFESGKKGDNEPNPA